MPSGRRIFVGDIQGCRQELESLLARCEFRPGTDRILPVGDLVNKGPDSHGVVRLLIEHGAESVLGNHDLWWLAKRRFKDQALHDWLAAQPVVRIHADRIQVHAGLHPAWTEAHLAKLHGSEVEYATNVRYCTADGTRPAADWPPPSPPFRPWDEYYRGKKPVVCGHWARRGLVRTANVISLDTGCCYGGKLSAWIAEEDRIVQVPSTMPRLE